MKIKKFILLELVGILPLIKAGAFPLKGGTYEKLDILSDYDQVCVKGDFSSLKNDKNLLPYGYHGNAKDEGIYEIGFEAGDPLGGKKPDISLASDAAFRVGTSICFEQDITKFPLNDRFTTLGYDIEIVKSDKTVTSFSYRGEAMRVADLFIFSGDWGVSSGDDLGIREGYAFTYYKVTNSLNLLFNLRNGEKLRGVRFVYGDHPIRVTHASLYFPSNPFETNVQAVSMSSDCTAKSYTRRVDTSIAYRMDVEVGKRLSKEFLLNQFVARDEYDGSEFHIQDLEDPSGYFISGEQAPIGSVFTIALLAEDTAGNIARLHIELHVVDKEGPLIQIKESDLIECSYRELHNQDAFISNHFKITDNSKEEVMSRIIMKDGSILPVNTIGEMEVFVSAEDRYGNERKLPFKLKLIDDISPEIEKRADELTLSYKDVIASTDLLKFFTAKDEIDGDLPVSIVENTYSVNARKVGDYVFSVRAIDDSGNEEIASMTIHVTDSEGPVFYAKESIVTVLEGIIPTEEEIARCLIRQGVLPDDNYIVFNIIEGDPLDDSLPLGKHNYVMELKSDYGVSRKVSFVLEIVEKEKLPVTDGEAILPEDHPLSFWEKIAKWFTDLFKKIGDFFRGLFS